MRQEVLKRFGMVGRPDRRAGRRKSLQIHTSDRKPAERGLKACSAHSSETLSQRSTVSLSLTSELQDEIQRLRSLSAHRLEAQEEERRKISKELHDKIGTVLSGIKFKIENTILQMEQGKASPDLLKDVIPVIQRSVEASRRLIAELRPSILDDLGLLAAINWYGREFERTHGPLRLETEIHLLERDVPGYLKIPLYRIVQEGLNSIVRHRNGCLISLCLQKRDAMIELVIRDDRKESNSNEIQSLQGTQESDLDSVSERTEMSGGYFVIESSPVKGMCLRACWPINVNDRFHQVLSI